MAQTKVSLIQDNVIVVGHLHTNHGITTGHIGEGSNLYFTDARVMTSLGSVSTHIIPDTNIAYDLGSPTNRFRDLYLSSNTIHLGTDTKITVNNDGEVEFKDSSDAPKRLKVRELDFVDDQGRNKRFKIDATSGRLATFDAVGTLTADKLDLSAMSTTDLAEGSNLYYTDARVGTYLTTNNYATQSYVQSQVSGLVASAPSTLDTLNELAAALGDDPNFATTVSTQIGGKLSSSDSRIANWDTAYGWGNHASAGYLTSVSWGSVTGKPSTFPPSSHTHAWSEITGKPSTFTPSAHNHDDRYYTESESDARFALAHSHPYLSDNSDSEQTIGSRINYFNVGGLRMNMDPRWNEGGYDGDNGNLHIWSTRADGGNYGRAGIALYNGSAYQYLTTKGGQNALYHNNSQIITTSNIGSQSVNYANSAGTVSGTQLGATSHGLTAFTATTHWAKPAGYQTMIRADQTTGDPGGQSYYGYTITSRRDAGGGYSALLTGYANNDFWITYNGNQNAYPTWRRIWTDANDGSGSGLDADLLDGQHASSFAPAGGSAGTDWYCDDLFYDQWIRNNGTGDSGLYWHNSAHAGYAWHIYPQSRADMTFRTGSGNGGIKGTVGDATARGYVHWTTSNEIGFLNNSRSWSLRVDSSGNTFATGSHRAPIFYDSNNTGYYVDPASTSNFNGITSQGESNFRTKRHYFGLGNNWDAVGVSAQTNVHFQGHNQFWVGAGNGTWFTGTANSKSATSGLSADASVAHDLLITTMQSTSAYDRGITFAVDNAGNGNSGWRLGKWHSGDAYDSSKLTVDGGLFVKGGYTDEFEYYADDYSGYYSSQGGTSYWTGGTNAPSITASTAIQIQAGNKDTNARNPQLQFHQYGYGGVQFRYDGPNDRMYLEPLGSNRFDWYRNQTDHGYIDFGPANSGNAHIYTDRANFYFNKQLTVSGGSQVNSGDVRANIFYDNNDTNVRLDSTRLVLRGTDPTVIFRDTDHTSAMWHVNSHRMYLLRGNGDTEGWTQVSGQWPVYWDLGNNNAYFGGTVVATNAVTAPIFYDSDNTGYYTNPASTSNMNTVQINGTLRFMNYGLGVTGTYTSTRLQTIFNMDDQYSISADGSSASGAYGLYWSHQNAGGLGGANNLASHGILIIENGSWKGAWGGGSLRTPGDVRAPIFYDYNNTGYYLNAASTSRINRIDYTELHNTSSNNNGRFLNHSSWGTLHQTDHGYIQFGPANTGHAHIYTDRSNFWFNAAINSTGDITAYASDKRLKENCKPIEGALEKVKSLTGMTYNWNDLANEIDPKVFDKTKSNVGVFAQDVQEVLPEAVKRAPFDLDEGEGTSKSGEDYLTVQYERMVPLLIEAIKEQQAQIDELKKLVSLHK